MVNNSFFNESREQSIIKAEIVSKYFWTWAKIIIKEQAKNPRFKEEKLAYIDLFAGPGRYEDGSESTPIRVLTKAIREPEIREKLITIFNDKDENNSNTLKKHIDQIPGINFLKNPPVVFNEEIGDRVTQLLEKTKLMPTFCFIDPWGYKGLSLRLVNSVIKDWGCDCIFFFNYNRINMGITNQFIEEHMKALFGGDRIAKMISDLQELSNPECRELYIINELINAISEYGARYIIPFRFRNEQGSRTTHHLIFISKHVRGYAIMKEIMAKYSTTQDQGVPSFEYNPADARFPYLFGFNRPLEQLGEMLLNDFKGQHLTMIDIYNQHHIGKSYIRDNYKQVLLELEIQGKIIADPPLEKRRMQKGKRTFADSVKVFFP